MANATETNFTGTVVEVAKNGTTVWGKFVTNEGAINIDYGTNETSEKTDLESGETRVGTGVNKYSEQEFEYSWTQALTSVGDGIVKTAKTAVKGEDKKVNFRITMNNATGVEVKGTIYIVPFTVIGYTHQGDKGGVWTTKVKVKQIGAPVETPAA